MDSLSRTRMHRIPLFLFLQLLVSFFVVGVVALQLTYRYGPVIGVMAGCCLGLLLTANLFQSLLALQVVLDRLARGLPVELVALYRYWPLQMLFRLVSDLEQQRGQQVQIEQQTVAYKDQLMLQVIATTAQEERNRLARDLHDSIKQQIFSVTMSAAAAKARWEHDLQRVRGILDDIERTSREAQVEMQAMLQQLRPHALENTGLVESLRMQSQALEYRTGATVTVEIGQLPPEDLLAPGAHEVMFRIVQEGFANIARHARASQVWLSLYQQGQILLLEIGDDGQGFDLASMPLRSSSGGMGMQNIRERTQALHGTFQLWSMVDKGTTLLVTFPLLPPTEPSRLDTEQPELEQTVAIQQTSKILALGFLGIELGAASLLLCAPRLISLIALTLGGLCAAIVWIVTYFTRMQLSISLGRKHSQHRYLVWQEAKLLLGLLTLALFAVSAWRSYTWSFNWPVDIISICLLASALRYVVDDYSYRRSLTHVALRTFLHVQQQQLGLDFLAWSIAVGGEAFFGILTPDLHAWHFSQVLWEQNAALSICLLWFFANAVKGLALLYWQLLLMWRKG